MCLPLLSEVSEALADYLFNARPDSTENRIFLRCVAPFQPVTTSVLRFETSKYFETAGIDTKGRKHGPHTFRSSLATSMVNDHIPYEAVMKILGHTAPDAIKHYAKLDIERLRLCAVEVPEATGLFAEFLKGGPGHASLNSTQIYAEISQNTADKHLKEWGEKWFRTEPFEADKDKQNRIPEFLNV